MLRTWCLFCSVLLMASLLLGCQQQPEKSSLKVLYVGYNPERSMPDFGEQRPNGASPERFKKLYKTRMPAFKRLLARYFTTVKTMDARDYKASVSGDYDVTIFDARPKPIKPEIREYDDKGQLTKYRRAQYLPKDFDKPTIFIASTAPVMGQRLGLKLDWECECLDADAHHIKTESPIFHTPLHIDLTMKDKPTPDGIYNYASGQDVPKEIPMWTVQTEGYEEGNGYMIGMVSRGGGFEDSPDAEVISSGVCLKDVHAVALGRHGNFFMWGFSGSPDYMTEQAKKVFVNTIHYIDQFDGRPPLVHKWNDRIRTRPTVDSRIYRTTYTSYKRSVKSTKEFNKQRRTEMKRIKQKKEEGKDLTRMEKAILRVGVMSIPTRQEYIKQSFPDSLVKKFGTDTLAYRKYYRTYFKKNRDYFYYNGSDLVVDKQVKKLGMPNNSPKLLDRCISMLEQGQNVETASDILHRYTNKDFQTPKAWRNWFETNKDRLFFTEAGGYKFRVDTYTQSSGSMKKVSSVESKIKGVYDELQTPTPNSTDPVAITAGIVKSNDSNPKAVVLKANVLKNWHIYAVVSKNNPYIETKLMLNLPVGIRMKGNWQEPAPKGLPGTQGVFVYEGDLQFAHLLAGSSKGDSLTVGMHYQVCDANQCLPPTTKKISIIL